MSIPLKKTSKHFIQYGILFCEEFPTCVPADILFDSCAGDQTLHFLSCHFHNDLRITFETWSCSFRQMVFRI